MAADQVIAWKGDEREEKIRSCLKCGQDFRSTWAGHRICFACRRKNRKIGPWNVRARVVL